MNAKELIKLLECNGWYEARCRGSHRIFKHPEMSHTIPVAFHGSKDIPQARNSEQNFESSGFKIESYETDYNC